VITGPRFDRVIVDDSRGRSPKAELEGATVIGVHEALVVETATMGASRDSESEGTHSIVRFDSSAIGEENIVDDAATRNVVVVVDEG
jgi:hypothetical protein